MRLKVGQIFSQEIREVLKLKAGSNISLNLVDEEAAEVELEIVATGGAGGGAPTTAEYLVASADATLSNEVVVGTTPGGELGGTWASPTVDAVHSGSSHGAVQAAAEATAATALSSHLTDTSDAHDASAISFSPTGSVSSTDVQGAIAEVAAEAGGGTGVNTLEYRLAGAVAEGATSFTLDKNPPASAAHQGWFIIDPWTTSCEIWRPTSISGAVVTCTTLSGTESNTGTTISFVAATKKIVQANAGVARLLPGERIAVTGSASNNGNYTVAALPTDGSYDGTYIKVVESLVDESAGASVTLTRRRRAHSDGATVLFTQGPIPVTWFGAKASQSTGDASANRLAIQRALDDSFYAQCYDIYLPGFMAGRYYIDAPLYADKNIQLRGPNQKAAVIAAAPGFVSWNDNTAMLHTRRNGLICLITGGGNDRYFFSDFGLDGGSNAYAKNTGYDQSSDQNGTAYVTSATNTVAIHATLHKGLPQINQRIHYRALSGGTGGNSIRIAHVNDGPSQPLTVTASGNDITVHLATNGSSVITSTAAAVVAAVNADVDSNALVEASLGNEGDTMFNLAADTLIPYNDGSGVVEAFVLTALEAGTAPFASGDVGRSIYLGMRHGRRNITGFTNSHTVTVDGTAFTHTRSGLRFAVSPVNGLIGSYNQTSILRDMRVEAFPGYATAFAGCQEFSVSNLMTLFSGVHRLMIGVQFGHFYDCNMEHTLDAYVIYESSTALGNISRANHHIGGHIEDIGPCDYFREDGDSIFEGLNIIDYQATASKSTRVIRIGPNVDNPATLSVMGWVWSGPNDGCIFLSDAVRGVDIPMKDFETFQFAVDGFFIRNGNINTNRNVVSKTAAYTMHVMDKMCLADATGGAFSVALPAAAQWKGLEFTVKRMNSGGNAVTVDPAGAETIDGAATVSLAAQYDRITVMSNGANWVRVD